MTDWHLPIFCIRIIFQPAVPKDYRTSSQPWISWLASRSLEWRSFFQMLYTLKHLFSRNFDINELFFTGSRAPESSSCQPGGEGLRKSLPQLYIRVHFQQLPWAVQSRVPNRPGESTLRDPSILFIASGEVSSPQSLCLRLIKAVIDPLHEYQTLSPLN